MLLYLFLGLISVLLAILLIGLFVNEDLSRKLLAWLFKGSLIAIVVFLLSWIVVIFGGYLQYSNQVKNFSVILAVFTLATLLIFFTKSRNKNSVESEDFRRKRAAKTDGFIKIYLSIVVIAVLGPSLFVIGLFIASLLAR
ncbi:MAG: hypothetical protein AAB473_02265 [Patescibacteria group bacterium]